MPQKNVPREEACNLFMIQPITFKINEPWLAATLSGFLLFTVVFVYLKKKNLHWIVGPILSTTNYYENITCSSKFSILKYHSLI